MPSDDGLEFGGQSTGYCDACQPGARQNEHCELSLDTTAKAKVPAVEIEDRGRGLGFLQTYERQLGTTVIALLNLWEFISSGNHLQRLGLIPHSPSVYASAVSRAGRKRR